MIGKHHNGSNPVRLCQIRRRALGAPRFSPYPDGRGTRVLSPFRRLAASPFLERVVVAASPRQAICGLVFFHAVRIVRQRRWGSGSNAIN
jgi:hypothetical protein